MNFRRLWTAFGLVVVVVLSFAVLGWTGWRITPGFALYYMQGLNTTPVHGHAALFGIYGTRGIGLMLFSLRARDPVAVWKEGPGGDALAISP